MERPTNWKVLAAGVLTMTVVGLKTRRSNSLWSVQFHSPPIGKHTEVKLLSFVLNYPPYPNRFKIKRIPVGKPVTTKRYLTAEETAKLFDGEVVIEEKIDGRQACRVFSVEDHQLVIGGEYMRDTHSISYNKLPDWYVAWDIFDPAGSMFLGIDKQLQICEQYGIPHTPVLFKGVTTLSAVLKQFIDTNRISSFGDEPAEGVVIKNFQNNTRGKIVRHEFIAGIELTGHWTRRKGLVKKNRLMFNRR
jgi:hypothetical protein